MKPFNLIRLNCRTRENASGFPAEFDMERICKPMIRYKKLLSIGLAAACVLTLAGCGKEKKTSYDPLPKEDPTIYSIRVCLDNNSDSSSAITQGFTDALIDTFGQEHIQLNIKTADEMSSVNDICEDFVAEGAQLIFTNGEHSLTAASAATTKIPIVASGVMDFQRALHIVTEQDREWDRLTGTNITGVSNLPSISDQLSMLIETTKNLKSVGILYLTDDTGAVYQNELLERFLDEAGIPWKEYALPSLDAALEGAASNSDAAGHIITPSKIAAASGKEGPNTQVESFGESNLLSGINSPTSVRTPKTSASWTADLTPADLPPLAEDAQTTDIVRYASTECSALYISSQSLLAEQMETIASAVPAGIVTVGGDAKIGRHTLVSMYADPYAQGYEAGKLAYRILVGKEDPASIKIVMQGQKDNQKLYNGSLAASMGITFPKSFTEINEFLETYEIGSNTERIERTEEK